MTGWLREALERTVVWRAARVAIIVGSILVAINHGDAILHGDISRERLLRMALTVLVPYCVSTYSSVEALRRRTRDARSGAESMDVSPDTDNNAR